MKSRRPRLVDLSTLGDLFGLVLLVALLAFPPIVRAGGVQPMQQQLSTDHTDRLIVKLRNQSTGVQAAMASPGQAQALSATAGVSLSPLRVMATGAQLLKLPYRMSVADAAAIAERLNADPNVEYAEPDRIKRPMLVPTDPRYVEQWHYHDPVADGEPGSINLPGATTSGDPSIVIAVIDTGVLPSHEDLTGRTLPGYDFIPLDTFGGCAGLACIANDGDGRDNDPSDPGDWITAAENAGTDPTGGFFLGCPISDSSWHGSHVTGTVGARANNAVGGSGVNWTSMILPVRVLGKCGGFTSDIVDGMLWAAGFTVTGVPDVPATDEAHVLNLSLGGLGPCSITEQTAIDTITAAGTVVVIAAGNDGSDASLSSPGNCNGVITVAATNRAGGQAVYTNFGTVVEIAAPGGETFPTNTDGVLSTINTGTQSPVADAYAFYQGTSMATPHVSGIVSLMLSVNSALMPTRILNELQATARTFPTGTPGLDCNTSTCGAGIVDAAAVVQSVSNAIVPMASAGGNQSVDPGTLVALDGSASTASGLAAIANYSWTQIGVPAVTLLGANTATATFIAPSAATGTVLTFQLTVTDDGGLTDMAMVTVILNNAPPTVTAPDWSIFLGTNMSFTVTAPDPNGTTPTLAAVGVPAGATFTPATGVFDWPNAGPLGSYVVTFTATDTEAPFTMVNDSATITVQSAVAAASASSSGSSSCFIATAAYGTPMADEIRYLRAFRDGYLLPNRIGRRFVELYYRHSPPIADYISQRQQLRRFVRVALMPLVALSKWLVGDRVVDSSHHAPR